ncbi:MAG: hypothetical protein MJ252_24370 [archaeon]|nr:hypothetical protein [archaeon]
MTDLEKAEGDNKYEQLTPVEDNNKFRVSINDDYNSSSGQVVQKKKKEETEDDSAEEEEREDNDKKEKERDDYFGRPSKAVQIAQEGRASRANQFGRSSRVNRVNKHLGKKPELDDAQVDSIFQEEIQEIKDCEEYYSPLSIKKTIKDISVIAFPSIVYNFSCIVVELINLAFLGQRYDDKKMVEAIGISNLLINCTTIYVFNALMAGIENLCSNALSLKHYKLMGYYYQRARIIAYLITGSIIIVHIFTLRYSLYLFSDDEDIIDFAKIYCYFELGQAFVGIQGAASIKMLEVFELGHVCIIVNLITTAMHPLWCYITIYKFNMGIAGGGLCLVISMFLNSLLSTWYLWAFYPYPKANFWINKKCFAIKGLCGYLKFTAGAAFLEWAELFSYEVMSMFALFMEEPNYAVYVILLQLIDLLYAIPLGFVQAMTILVADLIASKSTRIVKKFTLICITFACIVEAIVLIGFYIFAEPLYKTFTTEKDILDMGLKVNLFLCINQFLDTTQACMMAILKGLGKQNMASGLMFLTMYGFQPAGGYIGGFLLKGEVYGMFVANTVQLIICNIIYLVVVLCIDFDYAQELTIKMIIKDRMAVGERESVQPGQEGPQKGLLPESFGDKKKSEEEGVNILSEKIRKKEKENPTYQGDYDFLKKRVKELKEKERNYQTQILALEEQLEEEKKKNEEKDNKIKELQKMLANGN